MDEFDSSRFENVGWRAFIKWTKEWYHFEFPELSNEYKDNAIEYILKNNHKIFTKEDVLEENLCAKCGLCCKEIGCYFLDNKTNLCTRHDNQASEICRIYPWDDTVGFILTLNCGYQKQFVLRYLNKFFTKAIEMRCANGQEKECNNQGLD